MPGRPKDVLCGKEVTILTPMYGRDGEQDQEGMSKREEEVEGSIGKLWRNGAVTTAEWEGREERKWGMREEGGMRERRVAASMKVQPPPMMAPVDIVVVQ